MKKLFAISALALASLTAAAATNVDDLRVYLNPGHGSWTANDRPMGTIKHGNHDGTSTPDTCGFFESNTNLWKVLGILEKLREYGLKFDPTLNQTNSNPARVGAALDMRNNIVMSHVKLGPYPVVAKDDPTANIYNRNLSEISAEAERNNFDFFLSVHSNAHTDGYSTNYPALFVRGENKVAFTEGADVAARTFWPFCFQDEHNCWSNYSMTNIGLYYDIDMWHGEYLISNIDGKEYKGYYGVLRHGVLGFLCEGYFHTYQPARHRAMNPDVCRHEGTGYAHGIAAILGLETEKYGELYGIVRDKVESFRHKWYTCSESSVDDKKPINGAVVTLYKDGVAVDSYTTDDEWNGAFIFPRLEPGEYTIGVSAEGYRDADEDYCGPFKVEASKTTYPRVYLESVDYNPVYADYPDLAADAGVVSPYADSFNFKRSPTEKKLTTLVGKNIRRMIMRGDYFYILATDANKVPSVLVLDANRSALKVNLPVTGCEGSEYAISDIQLTADGTLIACAMQSVKDGGEAKCNIYRWLNDDSGLPEGEPRLWISTSTNSGLGEALTGRSMAYKGTRRQGTMLISSENTSNVAFTKITIDNGKVSSENVADYAALNAADAGEFTLTLSPLDSESFIINSPKMPAMVLGGEAVPVNVMEAASSQAGFFRFGGRSMMVAPKINESGVNTGIALYDITKGLANAELMTANNMSLPNSTFSAAAVGRTDVVTDANGNITRADIVLYTVRNNGLISRLSTEGQEQPEASLSDVKVDADAPVEYFNLQGMRIERPTSGYYIMRQGSTAKVVLK